MHSLLAIDLPLGQSLERVLRDCVEVGEAFCVLNHRLSAHQHDAELELLGATAILDPTGRYDRRAGREVDDEVGLVMLTSGSSGQPKAAELTWAALRASATLTQATLRSGVPPVWYPCLPANHIGGLAVVLRSILDDATLLWGDFTDLSEAARRGATHVSLVRTQLVRNDVSAFERVLLGGAKPPEELPDNVITTWGMTETGSGVVYDGVPIPGVEVVAVDGQIAVRSPTLFRSYRDAVRPTIIGPDGHNDWFPTGDAGDVSNGRVHVRGRLGFVINTGGEKLWPEDLEALLAELSGVRDVAVTSVDDLVWGQRVVALIVSSEFLDDAIRALAAERIGPWAKPKDIYYVESIPRTSNGKIRRADLAALL